MHVRFPKELHTAFKIKLFQNKVSMNDVLEEFARHYVADDPKVCKIVDDMVRRKVQEQIKAMTEKREKKEPTPPKELVGENDKDMLYDLINNGGLNR